VSNYVVGRLDSLRKFLVALSLSLCAVLFLTLLSSQVEQHLFHRRPALLLSRLQSLDMRKSSLHYAKTQFLGKRQTKHTVDRLNPQRDIAI
jgi:hypothetical protein